MCCAVAKGDAGVTSPGAGLGRWFGGLVATHVTSLPLLAASVVQGKSKLIHLAPERRRSCQTVGGVTT